MNHEILVRLRQSRQYKVFLPLAVVGFGAAQVLVCLASIAWWPRFFGIFILLNIPFVIAEPVIFRQILRPAIFQIVDQVWWANSVCPRCDYDLRATPDRCPECGTVPNKNEITSN